MTAPRLDELFRLSPNAYMVLDRSFRYVAANESYLKATATRLEDLLGRQVFELFPNDPDDPNNESARMLRRSFERVLETGKQDVLALLPYRVPITREDGTVDVSMRYWSATHTPILDAQGKVAWIFQHTVDVSELQALREAHAAAEKEQRLPGSSGEALAAGVLQRANRLQDANRQLDEERRRLSALFDQAPGFMAATTGPKHVFEMCNEAYQQLVGDRSIVGLTVAEALPEVTDQGFIRLLDGVFDSGQPYVGRGTKVTLRRRSGEEVEDRWVDFVFQPVRNARGKVTGIFVQGHDVTEQWRAQKVVEELAGQLERRVEERTAELQEVNRELESFSYSVSHDLRAPLRHIAGFAQLLKQRVGKDLDDVALDYLQTINEAAAEGGKLVDDLLAFSRMGRAELRRTDVDLMELVHEVQRELAPELKGRQVTWHVAPLPEVEADPVLLRSAVKNLLTNAVKYSRRRDDALIEVGAATEGGEAHVWVKDNGVGFDMRYADKLFGVFQRLHPEEDFEGTGIGLANVRRIVTRHGGRVWAEGVPDEGATFHLTLPLARSSEARAKKLGQKAG